MHGRRIVIVVALGWAVSCAAAEGLGQGTQPAQADRPVVQRPAGLERPDPTGPPPRVQEAADLEMRIQRLRSEHKALMDELQAILDAATREKATQTGDRVRQLITARQRQFTVEVAALEDRLSRFRQVLSAAERKEILANRAGTMAPLFSLMDPENKPVRLMDYRGKVVVLEWIDPNCPFWRYHADRGTMANLAALFKDKGVVWLAVHSAARSAPEFNKRLVERYRLPYPVLADRSGRTAREYGVTRTPEMIVVDTKGTITYCGAIDNAPNGRAAGPIVNYVEKALSEVLAGKPVATANTRAYGSPVRVGR